MVIQSNMSRNAIVEVWADTEGVFNKYSVPFTDKSLEIAVEADVLASLLKDLNAVVGSSTGTCIKGG